jgi:hypothetical protein
MGKKTNESVREKELSGSPGRGAWDFPFVPAILSVLRNWYGLRPPPRGRRYRLTLTLWQPYLCPISGAHAYQAESSTGGRLVIVSPIFDGRGGGPPSWKFLRFCEKE